MPAGPAFVAFEPATWLALARGLQALDRSLRSDGTRLPPAGQRALADLEKLLAVIERPEVPDPVEAPTLLSTAETAERLGCSPRNVRGLAERGTLPAVRRGRRLAFHEVDVAECQRHRTGRR